VNALDEFDLIDMDKLDEMEHFEYRLCKSLKVPLPFHLWAKLKKDDELIALFKRHDRDNYDRAMEIVE